MENIATSIRRKAVTNKMPSFMILRAIPRNIVAEHCRPGNDACRFHGTRTRLDSEEKGPDDRDDPTGVCMRTNPITNAQALKFTKHTREGCGGPPDYVSGGVA